MTYTSRDKLTVWEVGFPNTNPVAEGRTKIEPADKDKCAEKKKPAFQYEKRMKARFKLRLNRDKMDKRKHISEHIFGTMKKWHNSGYILLKGMRMGNLCFLV